MRGLLLVGLEDLEWKGLIFVAKIRICDDANKTIIINSDQLVYALSRAHPGYHPEYPWMIEVSFVNGEKGALCFKDEETADRIMDGLYCHGRLGKD